MRRRKVDAERPCAKRLCRRRTRAGSIFIHPRCPTSFYNRPVTFDISVENKTDTNIRGISGYFIINDLFGNTIISIGCDFTGTTIPAGESVEFDDMGVDINQFSDSDRKLYSEKYEDLDFQYIVENVIYDK